MKLGLIVRGSLEGTFTLYVKSKVALLNLFGWSLNFSLTSSGTFTSTNLLLDASRGINATPGDVARAIDLMRDNGVKIIEFSAFKS